VTWRERLFARHRLRRDLAEEIQAHLDEKVDELVMAGMPLAAATAAARRAFGEPRKRGRSGQGSCIGR
jgi:hypothetical protein